MNIIEPKMVFRWQEFVIHCTT